MLREWELSDAEREILKLALEALDRGEQCRKILEDEGVTQQNRYGKIELHPAARLEKDSRAAAARLLAQLGLSSDDDDSDPAMRGSRRRPGYRSFRK